MISPYFFFLCKMVLVGNQICSMPITLTSFSRWTDRGSFQETQISLCSENEFSVPIDPSLHSLNRSLSFLLQKLSFEKWILFLASLLLLSPSPPWMCPGLTSAFPEHIISNCKRISLLTSNLALGLHLSSLHSLLFLYYASFTLQNISVKRTELFSILPPPHAGRIAGAECVVVGLRI